MAACLTADKQVSSLPWASPCRKAGALFFILVQGTLGHARPKKRPKTEFNQNQTVTGPSRSPLALAAVYNEALACAAGLEVGEWRVFGRTFVLVCGRCVNRQLLPWLQ